MVQIKLDPKNTDTNAKASYEEETVANNELECHDNKEDFKSLCGWKKIDTFLFVIALFAIAFGSICAFSSFGRWYSNDDLLSSSNFIQTKCQIQKIDVDQKARHCERKDNGEWCEGNNGRKKRDNVFGVIGEATITPCMRVKVSFKLVPIHLLRRRMYMENNDMTAFHHKNNWDDLTESPFDEENETEELTSFLHKDFVEEENFPECEENFCGTNENETEEHFNSVRREYADMQTNSLFVECWYNSKNPAQVFRYPPGLHMLFHEKRFRSLWWPMTVTALCFLALIFRRVYSVCCYICGPDEDETTTTDEEEKEKKMEKSDSDDYESGYLSYLTTPDVNGLPVVEEPSKIISFNETEAANEKKPETKTPEKEAKITDIYKVEVRPLAKLANENIADTNTNI